MSNFHTRDYRAGVQTKKAKNTAGRLIALPRRSNCRR